MNWTNVKLILAREIRDQFRDRRTLFMILVLPILLYPLLGMCFFKIGQFMRKQKIDVLIVGSENLNGQSPLFTNKRFTPTLFEGVQRSDLIDLHFFPTEPLKGEKLSETEKRADVRRRVESGEFDAALFFSPDFSDRLEAFRQAIRQRAEQPKQTDRSDNPDESSPSEFALQVPSPKIIYTTASEKSQLAFARLSSVLQRWTQQIGQTNLTASGVPPQAAKPFRIESSDVGKETGRSGAFWAKILPILLLISAMTGAFYPAVDLCSGEKERGTLETLLASPAERSEIVLGKLVTIMLFSAITAILNLVSMGITGLLVLSHIPDFGGPPPLLSIVWLMIALVPVSALFSALCLALAAFARSTKEGQYYLVPLLLVTMPLVVLPMTPGVELNLGNSLIPITGLVLLLRSLMEGHYWLAAGFFLPVAAVTLIACLLSIRWAIDQFNSESVLFRESERFDIGLWMRQLMQDREPTPTVAGAIFCGVLILLVRFFMSVSLPMPQGFHDFAKVTVVAHLVVIVTPALMMTVMFTTRPFETLLIKRPSSWMAIPAAAVLALLLHPVVDMLRAAVMYLYPVHQETSQFLEKIIGSAPHLGYLILLLAVLPAITEELAFRGFILSGLRHCGYKWRAIFFSALFFGINHMFLQQSILACLVGVIIGLIAIQSGSIFPCMAFHFVHNALGVAVGYVLPDMVKRWPALARFVDPAAENGMLYAWPVVLIAGLLAALLIYWFLRLHYTKTREEIHQDAVLRAVHASTVESQ